MNTRVNKYIYIIEDSDGKEKEVELTVNISDLINDMGMTESEVEKMIDDAVQRSVGYSEHTKGESHHTIRI